MLSCVSRTNFDLQPMAEFLDIVCRRRSVRSFTEEALTSDEVVALMTPALMAPTSKGKQAVEFVLADDRDTLERLSQAKPRFGTLIAGAALAIVVCGRMDISDVWIEDASVAATMLLLSAEEQGLGACWVQIRERLQEDGSPASLAVRDILQLAPEQEPLCVIAVGRKAKETTPHALDELRWERVIVKS